MVVSLRKLGQDTESLIRIFDPLENPINREGFGFLAVFVFIALLCAALDRAAFVFTDLARAVLVSFSAFFFIIWYGHQTNRMIIGLGPIKYAPVAQLDRATDF